MGRWSAPLMVSLRPAALAAVISIVAVFAAAPHAQQPPAPAAPTPAAQAPAPGRGRGPIPVDPRVQIRMHRFADTNEDIPYALFVSSKVTRDRKAPMIVAFFAKYSK